MVTNIILVVILAGGYFLAKKLMREAKRSLIDLSAELKKEKGLIQFEQSRVDQGLTEMRALSEVAITQRKQAENAAMAAQLVAERMGDPRWMNRFNDGRDNAKFN